MNFLFPLFLAGLAAVAIPILLHFRRQPPQKAVPFSSLMFLEPSPVPPVTRRKLEDWLLLALRCLALLLLALMFARPFVRSEVPGELAQGRAWCILLDVSASMQREGVWSAAYARIDETLAKIQEQDTVSFVTFDTRPRVVFGPEAWSSLPEGSRTEALRQAVSSARPGWLDTDLGQALVFASRQMIEGAPKSQRHEIVLISDFQEGASLDALHAASWPENVTVNAVIIEGPWQDNFTLASASVQTVEEETSPPGGAQGAPRSTPGATRVRVTSSRDARKENFTLRWEADGDTVTANVPPGGARMLPAPARPNTEAAGVLVLEGDAVTFDNRLYIAPPKAREVRVLAFGQHLSRASTASPLYYLDRALHPTPALTPLLEPNEFERCTPDVLAGSSLVFVFGEAGAPAADHLRTWVQGGGNLVYVAQPGDKGATLAALLGDSTVTLTEAPMKDALLQDLRFDHPLLRSFAEAGVRDFTKIRFWKHRRLGADRTMLGDAHMVAQFDDLSPAWLDVPAGRGRVLIMTSGWTPAESQFSVSSKFLPIIHAMLDWAVGQHSVRTGVFVGDAIQASAGQWQGVVPVLHPDGRTSTWDTVAQAEFLETDLPGLYKIGEGAGVQAVAVNLVPAEGRLAPMELSRLAEFGVVLESPLQGPLGEAGVKAALQKEDAQQEQGQKIWKSFLVAALVVLLLETWIAGRREGPQVTKINQPA